MNLNAAHIHVVLNHLPILGLPMAFVLLIWSIITKNEGMRRFALAFTVAIAAATIVVQLTGEPAEELIENLPYFSEMAVERHEDAAKATTILASIGGLFSLVQLLWRRATAGLPTGLQGVTLVTLLLGTASAAYTGFKGGEIRHEEFRTAPGSSPSQGEQQEESEDEEHERDEKNSD